MADDVRQTVNSVEPLPVEKALGNGEAAKPGPASEGSETPSTWAPVDLGPALRGELPGIEPGILYRSDGIGLLYPGSVNVFMGEPETGKSWLAIKAVREAIEAGDSVVYFDFEDDERGIVERLIALRLEPDAIAERFLYIRPQESLTGESERELERVLAKNPALAVIDGVTEAMTINNLKIEDNNDAARFRALLSKPFADAGATVIEIDHVTKSKDQRGQYPIGAQAKLAGVDGAAYRLETKEPFGRGRSGTLRMRVSKDRPGHVRAHTLGKDRIADIHLRPEAGDRLSVQIEPAGDKEARGGTWEPTWYMEQVSRALEEHPGGLSKNAVESLVGRSRKHIRTAVELLEAQGFIEVDKGRPGKAHLCRHMKPYRAIGI